MQKIVTNFETLLGRILALFAYNPEDLRFKHEEHLGAWRITVYCRRSDFGRIVGRDGDRWHRIKDLAALYGERHRCKIEMVKVEVGKESPREVIRPTYVNDNWPKQLIADTIADLLKEVLKYPDNVVAEISDRAENETIFTYTLSTSEPYKSKQAIKKALQILLPIIGVTQGRILKAKVSHEGEEADRQPAHNVGRFCEE